MPSLPRPVKVVTSPAEDVTTLLWGQGYALVAAIDNGQGTAIAWVGQK
jgi:hypothetical protein